MYTENDLLPLSALQHLAFCERQWALIHIEQQWTENRLTAEGRQLHERAHDGSDETRNGVRISRGLRLRCLRLGLAGIADVIEFHAQTPTSTRPYPIEYKRGKPKPGRWDEVQLCAQALCLEEMLGVPVPDGGIFYGQPRRRIEVRFDPALRTETERLAFRLHEMQSAGVTPPAVLAPHCKRCSLQDVCLPHQTEKPQVSAYIARTVAALLKEK